ncbi:MAG: hypothetical protein EAZ57_10815 [Cytophagales bacterium]|nr:MAG: hypothetical protein EAZ67_11415 [Cytophagales bacterium]TAF59566.1 MAG: hypothetical protein EAZ57_10815 [Cytophagales bacterium]
MKPLLVALRTILSLDTRSLALYRIALGLVLLGDLLMRSHMLVEHYTDEGMLPRVDLIMSNWQEGTFSVLMLNGTVWFAVLFFVVFGLACVCLSLGFFPHIAILICWVAYISLNFRNPFANNSGDFMMLIFLVWSFFLPFNHHFSVRPSRKRLTTNEHFSGVSALFVIQISVIYFSSAILKSGYHWTSGVAVSYALQMTYYTSDMGRWLLSLPSSVHAALTYGSYYLEKYIILLVFIPFKNSWFRLLVFLSYWCLHLGFVVFLSIGAFPWYCMAFWLAMLPRGVWDGLGIARKRGDEDEFEKREGLLSQVLSLTRHAFGVAMIGLVLFLNFIKIDFENTPPVVLKILYHFKMSQSWGMFAPNAAEVASWVSAKAETRQGQFIDILAEGKPYQDSHFDHQVFNCRHRKYLVSLMDSKLESISEPFAHYIFRDWNRANPTNQIVSLTVYRNLKSLSVDPKKAGKVRSSTLFEIKKP